MNKKYYFIIPTVLLVCLMGGFFAVKFYQNRNSQQASSDRQDFGQMAAGQMPNWEENFTVGDINALDIGQRVLVMGTENSDGSIAANRIIMGGSEINFDEFRSQFRMPERNGDNNEDNVGAWNFRSFAEGDQPSDFERFQNMSEDERTKFREEMMAQRATVGLVVANSNNVMPRNTSGGRKSMVQLQGEVLGVDDSSLTLKIEDGGSKLIFFSEDINVLSPKQ